MGDHPQLKWLVYQRLLRVARTLRLSPSIHILCKTYVDRYNGENDSNLETNGEMNFLRGHAPLSSVCFDVGANRGDWAERVLDANPAAVIHCFEPCKTTFVQLSAHPWPPQVILNNFGLSSSSQSQQLYVFKEDSGMNSLYRRTGLEAMSGISVPAGAEVIELMPLDDYCESRAVAQIDFLKIDTEGHEYHVLAGARKMLKAGRIKRIQFEYGGCYIHAGTLLLNIFNLLEGLDYRVYRIMPDRLVPVPAYDQRLENFQYKNFAVLHADVRADLPA